MRDWRTRGSRLRAACKDAIFSAAGVLGRFEPHEAAEKQTVQTAPVTFFGDRPQGGTFGVQQEHRVAFSKPRPFSEKVASLSYSPSGIAWTKGRIVEKYSLHRPSLSELKARPPAHPDQKMQVATIVESDYPYSYGDWLHCYLGSILTAVSQIKGPVLIPETLYRKSYVKRDLAIAQIDYQPVTEWIQIEQAVVLRKRNFGFIWDEEYCASFISKFATERPSPTSGSLVYFARGDVQSETNGRIFPTEVVAGVVEEMGGQVIDQSHFTPDFAKRIAPSCDIVILDHGSGGTNMMYWKPSLVIELFVDHWWTHNNLFLSDTLNVGHHAVLDVDDIDAERFRQKLKAVFDWAGRPFPPSAGDEKTV